MSELDLSRIILAIVAAVLSIGYSLFKLNEIRNTGSIKLIFDGRVDFLCASNGRYLARLVGNVTNKNGLSTSVDRITIDGNTIPWHIPEEFKLINNNDKTEIVIQANKLDPFQTGPSTDAYFPLGNFYVWYSSDKKPRCPVKVSFHVRKRKFRFRVEDIREHSLMIPPSPLSTPLTLTIQPFGSLHD